jgi:predicted amidophosphoribosyltransferase
MDQKKCPHCGKWSSWNRNLSDLCDHCGKTLGGKDLENQERMLEDRQKSEINWMFNPNESDSSFIKGLKKIGNFFYTIFMAIISFILWLIAVLPG